MSSSNVRFKRSAVTGKRPSLENINLGELGINYYDGNLFTRQDTGGVGIATTVTNLTPWTENYGGTGIEYTGNVNVVGVSTFDDVSIGGTLSLSGAGSQFFAYNEDTVKVKFANWYSTNTRQYGMGQLWYETWFAAIDDTGGASNRRIGFYLDLPDKGASDASGGTGAHPTNATMFMDVNNVGINTDLNITGDADITGALSKGSGTFTIDHPVREGHKLVHSFVEGPLCDLIYRGKAKLQDGVAVININEHFGMHPGTFESLVDSTDVFITNNNSWDQVRGKLKGAELHIECQNKKSKTTVSWLVIGDRKDPHIKGAKWTDDNGKPILEPAK